ncbi:MAG: HAD-like domain-containing protein [Olpidium bornovanus]|uniref:HAD-like domain-containing protein n=1 Tax=Olpidium bornovanus TaxID=278681 RepID=A0A8H7ZVT8_9FUNG|nr:MAG: HAD-like domain-containing protein [Olpidium bornovanus]
MRSFHACIALAAAFAALAAAAPTIVSVSVLAKPLFDGAAANSSSAGFGAPGKRRQVKLIASDVDGTLLNSEHKFTPRTLSALKSMPDQCTFVIATGKSRGAVVPLLQAAFGADRAWPPSINLNGLITYGAAGQVLKEHTMRPQVAAQVVAYAERNGLVYVVHSGKDILSARRQEGFEAHLKLVDEPAVEIAERLEERLKSGEIPCHKIIFFFEKPAELASVRDAMPKDPSIANMIVPQGSPIDGEHVYVMSADPKVLEVCPAGISKATALAGLSEIMGVERDEVVALGDGENDIVSHVCHFRDKEEDAAKRTPPMNGSRVVLIWFSVFTLATDILRFNAGFDFAGNVDVGRVWCRNGTRSSNPSFSASSPNLPHWLRRGSLKSCCFSSSRPAGKWCAQSRRGCGLPDRYE